MLRPAASAGALPATSARTRSPPRSCPPPRGAASDDDDDEWRRRDALASTLVHPSARCVGAALEALVRDATARARDNVDEAPRIPALLDERRCPLCGEADSAARCVWHDDRPRVVDAVELADFVLARLRMDTCDAVVAMALVHTLVARRGPIVRAHSARPIFLAACVLARKLGSDADIATPECSAALDDEFDNLSALLLARLEEQLLELLNWRIPLDPEVYASCARALDLDLG